MQITIIIPDDEIEKYKNDIEGIITGFQYTKAALHIQDEDKSYTEKILNEIYEHLENFLKK
jgi:hypothetical protein